MENQFCFDCLRSRIAADFSDKLVFSYGISDSAFALSSSAVVQTPIPGAEASPQFVLVYLPSSLDQCLIKYIDEYCQDDPQRDSDETPVSVTNKDQEDGLSSDGRRTSLAWFGCKNLNCNFSGKFSCSRTITSLAPIARIGVSSYSAFEEIASNYLSGFGEDHILSSLSLLIEGKTTTRDAINFLSLIGVPSFDDNRLPGCLRHPNIVPILGMMKVSNYINLVLPKTPYSLESILHYSPGALKSEWHIKFLIYQLLSALAHMHGLGVAHGNICPSNVMLTDCCWSWLRIDDKPYSSANLSSKNKEGSLSPSLGIGCCVEGCPYRGVYADLKLSQSIDWHSAFTWWWRGELSNFEYLLVLNRLAGRRWGDHTFHPVLPWVVDFTVKPDETNDIGWRDLSKSKWRLAKGDEQLDFTYSTSEVPHHVSDECLSELAVCSYKARRLPLSVLRMAVRAVYEPNEYPSSMQRLYQWTPDECIPEFYFDPQIFYSLHSGMSDLAVPSWAGMPEQFIKLHRDALESNRVSREIHHWIDITFGYKMSGEAAILAKNVMLPASEPTMPRSAGRRQLFTQPHPARLVARKVHNRAAELSRQQNQANQSEGVKSLLLGTAHLQELEESVKFCEHARHLSPIYCYHPSDLVENDFSTKQPLCENLEKKTCGTPNHISNHEVQSIIDLHYLLDNIEVDDGSYLGYQELLLWRQKSSCSKVLSGNIGRDIFSVGCILAELYLGRPLFDPTSLATYLKGGVLPSVLQELPPHTKVLVGACIEKDSSRRPSAKCLLESPYFSATIRSSYLFLAPLQLLVKSELCLCYAANFAKQGAFKAMGPFAAEMCAPYCLPLVVNPLSDTEAEWAYILLKEFLKCLKPKAVKALILPAIQKILQATGYSHLKVSLLQDSFVREIWKQIGKQAYLETMHPLVILNLFVAPQKSSAAAAAVLLIGSSEELGVPVTVHQTILPLIHCYGKGLCTDGIDVLVRIGGLLGEDFVVRQILPLLRNVVHSCIDASYMHRPEPMQSWSSLALIDCLMTLDGLVAVLPKEVVIKELIEDGNCLHVKILMQTNLDVAALQVAATSLIAICEQIGLDLTALHVLPKLKELFYELAFSQETTIASGSFSRSSKFAKQKVEGGQIESRMDLVLLLYPPFASLLGIEKLRQCCSTWLLLEQFLLRSHNWKWEYTGESTRSVPDNINAKRPGFNQRSTSEYSPAKLLLNGVGWSIPQSQGNKSGKNLIPHKHANDLHQNSGERPLGTSTFEQHDPWYWFPSPAASWDGPDFLGRAGSMKDELPWKIRASIIHSIRGHHGTIRSLAVCQDECTVFTAGVGPGFRGTVQKWDLSRIDCISGYYGHEEVVNDICVLSTCERVASCDGTVHVWNSQTGKLISIFAESSANPVHATSPPSTSTSNTNADQTNILNSNPLSGGILSSAFDGSLYTCMHHLASIEKLVVGTGNGSLRFIDVSQGQKLHLWRSESGESSFPSLISSICACGPDKMRADGATTSPSWIAAGLSSGFCRLLDMRSGNIIASWRAHDGYVTKLAAPEEHLLVSSSLDKTLRIWDLRRDWPPQPIVFRGHSDGVSGFSVWGQDVISIAKNKIGLSSLSRSANEDVQPCVTPQYLYLADRGARNVSVLSSLSILPFSRLFLVGTEDGHLKICC